MLADSERGDAWTKIILGIPAKEVHICGDPTTVEWLVNFGLEVGEDVIVNRYERLTGLTVENSPLLSIQQLKPGDAVIVFSRSKVYDMRRLIESNTDLKCSMVYGSLPPSVRKLQATTFNEPDHNDRVLVATDAIGMGLNLNIRRIVFASVNKFDGQSQRQLEPSEVLQIGGRAGRYRSRYSEGFVSVLSCHNSLEYVRKSLEGGIFKNKTKGGSSQKGVDALPNLKRACLLPTVDHLLDFMRMFPKIPLYRYLEVLQRKGSVPSAYFFGDMTDMTTTARLLHGYRLSPEDMCSLCYAPFSFSRFPSHEALATNYAEALSQAHSQKRKGESQNRNEDGRIPIPRLTYLSHPGVPVGSKEIGLLEETYANLEIYLWLAQRFGTQRFVDVESATSDRDLVATLIHEGLDSGTLKRSPKAKSSIRHIKD